MNVLGISAFYHDSAAAIIQGGTITAAAHEERFTRKKHDPSFPAHAVSYCLSHAALSIDELDAVVFYDKPLLKFERLLETYYAFAPAGLASFLHAIPVWVKEKLFLKEVIRKELAAIEPYDRKKLRLVFPEHHLSHAASAFYPSPYMEAAILTIDGVGEWATASICRGEGSAISILKETRFPHSLGLLYSAFTYYLGFTVNSGEYKLMGLAPYGVAGSDRVANFGRIIRDELVDVKDDGSIWLNQEYFGYATGLRMVDESKWERLFGFPRRASESRIEQHHCDCALAIQEVAEEIVLKMAREAKRLTGSNRLCLAGGVALNCVANGKLLRERLFEELFIQPAAGDAGGAVGAALAAHYIYFGNERSVSGSRDEMQGAYLGPEYGGNDIEHVAKRHKAVYHKHENLEELLDTVAGLIEQGAVVGWFQGRMEFGPRALGNRSILGDARNRDMQKRLNLKIKYRESFRPFAPSVLDEDAARFFDLSTHSPYMLLVANVSEARRTALPEGYWDLPKMERLYVQRSEIQAVTHVDMSARIQTVHRDTNERYWLLLSRFRERTGCSVIVNTSFNVRGEPIVCSPEDAYRCFMRTEMDYLVMGDYLFAKTEQPAWRDSDRWKEDFKLD
jgi:carbamoyltransferase